ncbi:hypothetical protein Tco_0782759, partial [Tanacetum coccineum]
VVNTAASCIFFLLTGWFLLTLIPAYTSSSSSSDDDCRNKKKNAIDNMIRLYHSLVVTAFNALKIAFKIRSNTFREEANKFKDYRNRIDEIISLAIRYEITTGLQSLYIKVDGKLDGIDDSVIQERISQVQDDFAREWENIMFSPADDGSDHPQESASSPSKD